jgi:hypothetical protein
MILESKEFPVIARSLLCRTDVSDHQRVCIRFSMADSDLKNKIQS